MSRLFLCIHFVFISSEFNDNLIVGTSVNGLFSSLPICFTATKLKMYYYEIYKCQVDGVEMGHQFSFYHIRNTRLISFLTYVWVGGCPCISVKSSNMTMNYTFRPA